MSQIVRDAVFGNVGSMISFRVGADDATFLSKYFAPQFEPADLMQLHNRYFIATMSIAGEKTPPFSGSSLNIPKNQSDFTQQIIEWSRSHYANPKHDVEAAIEQQTRPMSSQKPQYDRQSHQTAPNATEAPKVSHVSSERAKGAAKLFVGNLRKLESSAPESNPKQPVTQPQATTAENRPAKKVRSKRKKFTKQTKYEQNDVVKQPQIATEPINQDETIIRLR